MENISKILISKEEAKRLGYVLDVVIDFETLEVLGYVVVDEESENEFFVSREDIKFVGEFAFVEDSTKMQFLFQPHTSLIGRGVLSSNGVDLGRVVAVKTCRNKFQKLVTDKGEIRASLIKNVGDDFVFLGKRKTRVVERSGFKRLESEVDVSILSTPKLDKPEKVSLSTSYYIGKISKQDIFGYNNERIVVKGEKINKATVEKVKKHNRLNELFFATKN